MYYYLFKKLYHIFFPKEEKKEVTLIIPDNLNISNPFESCPPVRRMAITRKPKFILELDWFWFWFFWYWFKENCQYRFRVIFRDDRSMVRFGFGQYLDFKARSAQRHCQGLTWWWTKNESGSMSIDRIGYGCDWSLITRDWTLVGRVRQFIPCDKHAMVKAFSIVIYFIFIIIF